MTAKELYDYILTQMSAEEALKKALSTTVQLCDDLNVKQGLGGAPLLIIADCCMRMGWNFAIENDQEIVRGMVVGTEEYIESIFKP